MEPGKYKATLERNHFRDIVEQSSQVDHAARLGKWAWFQMCRDVQPVETIRGALRTYALRSRGGEIYETR